jgi:hypothetical protein
VLDQVGLPQLWLAQRGVESCCGGVDAALAPASAQRGSDPCLRQLGCRGRRGRDCQDRAGIGRGEVAGGFAGEGLEECRVVSRTSERNSLEALVRRQVASWSARASTATAWARWVPAGSRRWACWSVRKMLANVIASAWSDLPRLTVWRSR